MLSHRHFAAMPRSLSLAFKASPALIPCSTPAGADALRRLRPAKAGLRALRRLGSSVIAVAPTKWTQSWGRQELTPPLGGRAFGPPLCRGCAPATPPSKTRPHRPCGFIAACRLASLAATANQLRPKEPE